MVSLEQGKGRSHAYQRSGRKLCGILPGQNLGGRVAEEGSSRPGQADFRNLDRSR